MLIDLPTNELTERIIGSGIEAHRELGPGLLEGTYRACLASEMQNAGLALVTEVPVSVNYKGMKIQYGYRLDVVVENLVVVEVKSVERLLPVHTAQLLTYLRLGGYQVGLLLNFNTTVLKNGIARVVDGYVGKGGMAGES